VSVIEFVKFLQSKPIKLRLGFIDFWLPLFFILNKKSIAFFSKDKITGELTYLPELYPETLELIIKSPKDFLYKRINFTAERLAFFNRYRSLLNQIEQTEISNKGFIEIFKPFIVFYKDLPPIARNTKLISEEAIKLRAVIENAIDPEETFFDDFPAVFGYTFNELYQNNDLIEKFVICIKEKIAELNAIYDKIINDIEAFIEEDILGFAYGFPENRKQLQNRFIKVKKELLKPKQKVFYNRVQSVLDDRKSWMNSLVNACINKNLDNIKDDDIEIIKHRLLEHVRELDNISDIIEKDIDQEKEELIKLEVTSIIKGLSKKYIRIPKNKLKKIDKLEVDFKKQLDKSDKALNIALLARLLQEQIDNDKES
jgi:hypothetical protein